ncbi:hypothetical protein [Yinghuangia seranimata]|uniref:hypothetical protein n=1 Tax=Yinghuangia seranimata TaxID=408067 RepID=UPI00248CC104|nr:hypothetical protein [Yinghuangia seranimata]MDI2132173.1 hypothetical protein [Yinghuangia seranimata]
MSTAHDEPHHTDPRLPEVRTIADLRRALGRYGFPGDRERFDRDLSAAVEASPVGDLGEVARVVTAYRHRLLIRDSPEIMAALESARPPGWTE